jgi:RNA polymerase sigma factor (sigma-70 family)
LERFLAREDPAASEEAFAVLVERHGAMVLRVCHRILGDPHDAQDAFQATFLLLVGKAHSVRSRESVAEWLLTVARRVALRARGEAVRRRHRLETLVAERGISNDHDVAIMPEPGPDYGPLLAEIDRLPARFRAAVVLHYFEGLSTEAAAQRLGCARGTVLSRLARARDRLRMRLERRGVSLEALLPASATANRLVSDTMVPASLMQATIRAACFLALAGATIETVVPAPVAALSRRVARTLVLSHVRLALVPALLIMASVSIGLAATFPSDDKPKGMPLGESVMDRPRAETEKSAPSRVEDPSRSTSQMIRGRVVDPDGKPVRDAQIIQGLRVGAPGTEEVRSLMSSGSDGRFAVPIPRESIERSPEDLDDRPIIAALAPGFGPEWIKLDSKNARDELTIRLRRDDVPIEGRMIGLEGRPVPGLTVRVYHFWEIPPDFLKSLRASGGRLDRALWSRIRNGLILGDRGPIPAALTGADGRFRLSGIGRDRMVVLVIDGDSIVHSVASVLTTSDRAFVPCVLPIDDTDDKPQLLGPRFDFVVAPGQVVEGVIRDGDTGLPVAGATVSSWHTNGSSLSDAQGRYRLAGLPKNAVNRIEVVVAGQPYVKVVKRISNRPGLEPIRLDMKLRRGVWVEGKVTNKSTGRPVQASVRYYPLRDNPHLKEFLDNAFEDHLLGNEAEVSTDAGGQYRAIALPGEGYLAVSTTEPGYRSTRPLAPEVTARALGVAEKSLSLDSYQALALINPRDGEKLVIPDITLSPGRPQRVQVVGTDGRRVRKIRTLSHQSRTGYGETVLDSEFTFIHRNPGKVETVLILQEDQGCCAFVDIKGNEPDPIRVDLQPTATVTGRLVDEDGRPRPDMPLTVNYELRTRGDTIFMGARPDGLTTGSDGRFRIPGLIPGLRFYVDVRKKDAPNGEGAEGYLKGDTTVKPGEVQDWGDVQVKKDDP